MNDDIKGKLFSSVELYSRKYNKAPYFIGVCLSFDQYDKGEVIIGIVSKEDVDSILNKYREDAKYYLWNCAEYNVFDDPECNPDISIKNEKDMEELKLSIADMNSGIKEGYVFLYTISDDDIYATVENSFDEETIFELKKMKYI